MTAKIVMVEFLTGVFLWRARQRLASIFCSIHPNKTLVYQVKTSKNNAIFAKQNARSQKQFDNKYENTFCVFPSIFDFRDISKYLIMIYFTVILICKILWASNVKKCQKSICKVWAHVQVTFILYDIALSRASLKKNPNIIKRRKMQFQVFAVVLVPGNFCLCTIFKLR